MGDLADDTLRSCPADRYSIINGRCWLCGHRYDGKPCECERCIDYSLDRKAEKQ